MPASSDPRRAVIEVLRKDLGQPTESDVRAAVLCGEMGCRDMQGFIESHPELRCPYAGREDGRDKCRNLHEVYAAAARDD